MKNINVFAALALSLSLFTSTTMAMPSPQAGQCSAASLLCCQALRSSSDPAVTVILGLLGIPSPNPSVLVGLTCAPVTIVSPSGTPWYVGSSGFFGRSSHENPLAMVSLLAVMIIYTTVIAQSLFSNIRDYFSSDWLLILVRRNYRARLCPCEFCQLNRRKKRKSSFQTTPNIDRLYRRSVRLLALFALCRIVKRSPSFECHRTSLS